MTTEVMHVSPHRAAELHAAQLQPTLELSDNEAQQLAICEERLRVGVRAWEDAGLALIQIREENLYRAHGTFEAYCRNVWGFGRQRAGQLMQAAEVCANVSKISDTEPLRESHVNALAALPPDLQREAWKRATEKAGGERLTAQAVKAAVAEVKPAEPVLPGTTESSNGAGAAERPAREKRAPREPAPTPGAAAPGMARIEVGAGDLEFVEARTHTPAQVFGWGVRLIEIAEAKGWSVERLLGTCARPSLK